MALSCWMRRDGLSFPGDRHVMCCKQVRANRMSLQCGCWRPPGEYVVPDGMEDVLPQKSVVDASALARTDRVLRVG